MRTLVLFQLLVVAVSGCNTPDTAHATPATTPDEAARKLYVVKCAKCHRLYEPARYTDAQWQDWMRRMTRKARLTPQQSQEISRYIQENLRQPKP